MNNKTTIRKENVRGEFTTINYSILRDNRLTSNAKVLMIEILSDVDGFKFLPSTYKNRMNIGETAFKAALNNLIQCGYIRKSRIGNSHYNHYIISEFGNLNNEHLSDGELISNSSNKKEVKTKSSKEGVTLTNEQAIKLGSIIKPSISFLTDSKVKEFYKWMDEEKDFYKIKSNLEKMIQNEKNKHFNKVNREIEDSTAITSKVKREAIKILKDEVFNLSNKVDYYTVRKRASQNINRRIPLDPKSLAADKIDGI